MKKFYPPLFCIPGDKGEVRQGRLKKGENK
jgi:hypothetical protein